MKGLNYKLLPIFKFLVLKNENPFFSRSIERIESIYTDF